MFSEDSCDEQHSRNTVLTIQPTKARSSCAGPEPFGRKGQSRHLQSCRYLHNWKDLWEDDAGLRQVLVEDALVELVRGVLDQRGLRRNEPSARFSPHCSTYRLCCSWTLRWEGFSIAESSTMEINLCPLWPWNQVILCTYGKQ